MSLHFTSRVEQNKAHREDMFWFKSGPSEYTHSSGTLMIRKNNNTRQWQARDMEGKEIAVLHRRDDGSTFHFLVQGYSLTDAKYNVDRQVFKGEALFGGLLVTI